MLPSGPIPSFPNTVGLMNGLDLNKLARLIGSSCTITAKAGGTKAAATEITGAKCLIDVCATNGDSAVLPAGFPGLEVTIFNAGAANAQIFGSGNDTINEVDAATGVTQNTGLSAIYTCYAVVEGVGIWGRVLSA